MKQLLIVPILWFLWSTVHPGGSYNENEIKSQPVKEFVSQEACEKALPLYRKEIEKAFPEPKGYSGLTWPTVELKCSPIYPR